MKSEKRHNNIPWLRLLGVVLLIVLLLRLDLSATLTILFQAEGKYILLAFALNLILVSIKTGRWFLLLKAQDISYSFPKAYLAYFSSVFIGLLTPGRLGELVRALHVNQDTNTSMVQSFPSVLVDRLFDLFALLIVGGLALESLTSGAEKYWAGLLAFAGLLAMVTALVLSEKITAILNNAMQNRGRLIRFLGPLGNILMELRQGFLCQNLTSISLALFLTVIAYFTFFYQCYLLSLSLGMTITYQQVSYATALGSLVTLLPISISGVGTRDAALIGFLATLGVSAEAAFGYSLLIFLVFYMGGGLLGGLAWLIKPVPFSLLKKKPTAKNHHAGA
ncbi:lysylphosphatidylglycerol synthase transmembrane domain-containing protein [Thermodesulfobacteriota bacterium]